MVSAPRSTDEVPVRRFQPHGRAEFWSEGRLLLTVAEGPFNAELVGNLHQLSLQLFAAMREGGAWAHLVIFRRSAMAIPEALAHFGELVLTLNGPPMGPVATAFVLATEVEGHGLMEAPFARCFQPAGLRFATFADEAQARTWLLAQL